MTNLSLQKSKFILQFPSTFNAITFATTFLVEGVVVLSLGILLMKYQDRFDTAWLRLQLQPDILPIAESVRLYYPLRVDGLPIISVSIEPLPCRSLSLFLV